MLALELRETEAQPRDNPDLPRRCPQAPARAWGGPGVRSPSGKGLQLLPAPRGGAAGGSNRVLGAREGTGAETARSRLEARSFTRGAGKQGFAVRICRYPRCSMNVCPPDHSPPPFFSLLAPRAASSLPGESRHGEERGSRAADVTAPCKPP